MVEAVLRAIVVINVIVGGWLLVQAAWRRTFAGDLDAGWSCHDCEGQKCQLDKDNRESTRSQAHQPGGE